MRVPSQSMSLYNSALSVTSGHETGNYPVEMFKYRQLFRMKTSVFSTVSFAALLFLFLIVYSAYSNFSLHVNFHPSETHKPGLVVSPENTSRRYGSGTSVLLSVKEETQENFIEDPPRLLPPMNVTAEERIIWFRDNIHRFEIINSYSDLPLMFSKRARKFFSGSCEIRFFMTWISSVASFGHREFISLESLFKSHPWGCLLILSSSLDSGDGNRKLKPLIDKGFRILAATPDLPFLLKNTPADPWFKELKKGNVDPGEIHLAQNLSNLLRLLVLYKYGGVYLDTDVIILKRFSDLKNSIGAQTMDSETGQWSRLNNAVLVFDKKHPLLFKFIQEFSLTFNGNKWGHNGPYLVSRVVSRVAHRPGFNFTVLPPMAFYPVDWTRIAGFFHRPENRTAKWVAAKLLQLQAETYAVHLWNRQSNNLRIEEGSVIERIISDHCIFCEHRYNA